MQHVITVNKIVNSLGAMGAYMRHFFDTLRGTLNSFVNIKNQVVNP